MSLYVPSLAKAVNVVVLAIRQVKQVAGDARFRTRICIRSLRDRCFLNTTIYIELSTMSCKVSYMCFDWLKMIAIYEYLP